MALIGEGHALKRSTMIPIASSLRSVTNDDFQ